LPCQGKPKKYDLYSEEGLQRAQHDAALLALCLPQVAAN
jgi:hypothetical protein